MQSFLSHENEYLVEWIFHNHFDTRRISLGFEQIQKCIISCNSYQFLFVEKKPCYTSVQRKMEEAQIVEKIYWKTFHFLSYSFYQISVVKDNIFIVKIIFKSKYFVEIVIGINVIDIRGCFDVMDQNGKILKEFCCSIITDS